jgi:hypothetical protein
MMKAFRVVQSVFSRRSSASRSVWPAATGAELSHPARVR